MLYIRKNFIGALKSELEENIFFHSLAVEACMAGLYDYLQSQGRLTTKDGSKEDWLIAGLIHDIDYSDKYKTEHPNKTKEVLEKYILKISDEVDRIVKAHAPELTGVKPGSLSQWAIFCCDSLTGLLVAIALVYPSKKLADVKVSSVLKRFLKEPRFAAGTRRDEVALCSKPEGLNISLEKFIEICLVSMQRISNDIKL